MPMGCPIGAEQPEGLGGQRDIAIFSALAAVDMDLEALAIDIGDLEVEGFMEPQAQAIDGGKVNLVVEGSGGGEEPLDLRYAEDGGKPVGDLWTNEREGIPLALEDVLIEKADTTVAEVHGRRGQTINIFAVQEVALQLQFRDAVRGFVVKLGQQADFSDIDFLSPFAFATEMERREHLLTQWGHE
jgi:hypothetical protein